MLTGWEGLIGAFPKTQKHKNTNFVFLCRGTNTCVSQKTQIHKLTKTHKNLFKGSIGTVTHRNKIFIDDDLLPRIIFTNEKHIINREWLPLVLPALLEEDILVYLNRDSCNSVPVCIGSVSSTIIYLCCLSLFGCSVRMRALTILNVFVLFRHHVLLANRIRLFFVCLCICVHQICSNPKKVRANLRFWVHKNTKFVFLLMSLQYYMFFFRNAPFTVWFTVFINILLLFSCHSLMIALLPPYPYHHISPPILSSHHHWSRMCIP